MDIVIGDIAWKLFDENICFCIYSYLDVLVSAKFRPHQVPFVVIGVLQLGEL